MSRSPRSRRNALSRLSRSATALLLFAGAANLRPRVHASPPQDAEQGEPPVHISEAAIKQSMFESFGATFGPLDGRIGEHAHVQVPEGLLHLGPDGTRKWLEALQNPTNGNELATVMPLPPADGNTWFVVFEFRDEGYVKDDEKNELDGDAMLSALREGTEAGNEERKSRGWSAIEIVGWEKPPFYDDVSKNLTWATRLRDERGNESVNWTTRLLGRRGHMQVDLVVDPGQLQSALPPFNELMKTFEYRDGDRYAQFVPGDKVAKYGLGALVVGGAGVAAAKLGLFAKFWKVIVVGVVGLAAMLKGWWKRLFGRDPKLDAGSGPSG